MFKVWSGHVVPFRFDLFQKDHRSQAFLHDCGNKAIATQCLVQSVPPVSGGTVHAICRFLQSCGNFLWMTCFWWQLTYDITIHTIRLSLNEGCFEINADKIQLLLAAIWQLIRNPGLVEAGESVCWYSFCLSWKPRSTNLAFAPRKLPLMVSTHRPAT